MRSGVEKTARATKVPARVAAQPENRVQKFIRETRAELRKVVWPTRQQATNLTIIVTSVSIAVGIFLGGVDLIFKKIFELIIGGF